MKVKYRIAVFLATLFLIPIFPARAEKKPASAAPSAPPKEIIGAFTIDQRKLLQGMNRTWLQGYEPKISSNVLSLVAPILSDQAEGTIQAELLLPDEACSLFKPQTMYAIAQRAESGLYPVRLNLELYPDRQNGDYPCVLRVTGKTRQGAALQTDIPLTLRIRDGAPNTESRRMEISGLQADLTVGESGLIRFTLTNPCKTLSFEKPVLRILDPSGDVIPQTVDVTYLPDLAPGESTEVLYPVSVLPKASVSPHSLKFDLTWTALWETVTQTESYTLPVRQEIRLEQGGLKMPSSVVAGDSVTLTLPLMNMGRAEIVNVLATVTLPGIADRQSVLVGAIAPGETRQAQITLTPGKAVSGDFEGALTVEGTDDGGNPVSFSLPIGLTVEKPVDPETGPAAASEEKNPPVLTYALAGGCGLLFLSLLLQGALLGGKLRRLEEEKL